MTRVAVKPDVLRWARERANLGASDLLSSFPKIEQWESGTLMPTFQQLEKFAQVTHVPFGYLFLPEPPELQLPIPDFRTLQNRPFPFFTPELLDTIYDMQRRQWWLREERIEADASPVGFIGTATTSDDPLAIGREMRRAVGLDDGWASHVRTWESGVSELRRTIEELGVIAVINGIVGNNTHRKLDVEEFRGFALVDSRAPVVFVNGADAKSAQMFTLAHEFAHLWLGEAGGGVSGFPGLFPEGSDVERFCDQAAAEFLVPESRLRSRWQDVKAEPRVFELLAGEFKVSPIVIGRRALDLRLVDRDTFFAFYNAYLSRERNAKSVSASRGNFYNNQNSRVGVSFASQVVRAAKAGRIGFKQAYDLTGLKAGSFERYARKLGFQLP